MLYIPKIDNYLRILTDEEVEDFIAVNFSEYSKSITEKQNLVKKVAKLPYIFLPTPDEVVTYLQSNSSDNCIHHYNVKILIFFDPEFRITTDKHYTND